MEKVKIPRFISEDIDKSRKRMNYLNQPENILEDILRRTHELEWFEWIKQQGSLTKLAQAIEYGYEVELTPEEQIEELYNEAEYNCIADSAIGSYRKGLRDVLEALGIPINF